ncbi:MAG: amino acid ABC transporter substrate-binding protein, partial [Desulfobacterales bacterium]|nr:amino acid ABC transporter substrate-binding protein [Desulfobacterales bacterium]
MHFTRKILLLLFLLCFASVGFAEETITLTNGEWPPYMSERLEHHGVVSRIVVEAFALEGVRVEYSFFPWIRALSLAKAGAFDGSVVWWKTPEREKDFFFSDPVLDVRYVFFHLKSNPF